MLYNLYLKNAAYTKSCMLIYTCLTCMGNCMFYFKLPFMIRNVHVIIFTFKYHFMAKNKRICEIKLLSWHLRSFKIFAITNNAVMNMFIYSLFLWIHFRNGAITANIRDIYKTSDASCWIALPRGYTNLHKN